MPTVRRETRRRSTMNASVSLVGTGRAARRVSRSRGQKKQRRLWSSTLSAQALGLAPVAAEHGTRR